MKPMPKVQKKAATYWLPVDLIQGVQQQADREGRNKSNMLAHILRRVFAQAKRAGVKPEEKP